jgi:hypothetical protein
MFMPIYDWSRVDAGIFHDFHCSWISEVKRVLNNGVLPPEYYALSEQVAGRIGPDVLTLRSGGLVRPFQEWGPSGATSVLEAPPKVALTVQAERNAYARRQHSLAIRHRSKDRLIAIIEILSPGNKSDREALGTFKEKVCSALENGIHLLLLDLIPPNRLNPNGIHGVVWSEVGDVPYTAPSGKPLTLAAYAAGPVWTAYIQPAAVGDRLIDMPLFLDPDAYVDVPLEVTYRRAWESVPRRWQQVLEGPATKKKPRRRSGG